MPVTLRLVFHVELRRFPHVAREFNLAREDLDARVLVPWARGAAVMLGDRTWEPDRAKLAIYEGRALATEEMGMDRGWANVTRTGEEVTARLLEETHAAVQSPPSLAALKRQLVELSADGPIAFDRALALAAELQPQAAEPQSLELAGRAVWELLSEGKLRLAR